MLALFRRFSVERVEQLLMDSAKTAVRHDQYHIAFAQTRGEIFHDRIGISKMFRRSPRRADGFDHRRYIDRRILRVPLGMKETGEYHFVGARERLDVVVLEFPPLSGVAARLEDRHDPPA